MIRSKSKFNLFGCLTATFILSAGLFVNLSSKKPHHSHVHAEDSIQWTLDTSTGYHSYVNENENVDWQARPVTVFYLERTSTLRFDCAIYDMLASADGVLLEDQSVSFDFGIGANSYEIVTGDAGLVYRFQNLTCTECSTTMQTFDMSINQVGIVVSDYDEASWVYSSNISLHQKNVSSQQFSYTAVPISVEYDSNNHYLRAICNVSIYDLQNNVEVIYSYDQRIFWYSNATATPEASSDGYSITGTCYDCAEEESFSIDGSVDFANSDLSGSFPGGGSGSTEPGWVIDAGDIFWFDGQDENPGTVTNVSWTDSSGNGTGLATCTVSYQLISTGENKTDLYYVDYPVFNPELEGTEGTTPSSSVVYLSGTSRDTQEPVTLNLYGATYTIQESSSQQDFTVEILFDGEPVTDDITLDINGSYTLGYETNPSDPNASVSWESSDTEVATINESGALTFHGTGSTTITLTAGSSEGAMARATCLIHVVDEGSQETFIEELQINFEGEPVLEKSCEVGDTFSLSASYTPDTAEVDLQWSTSDETSVSITTTGGQSTVEVQALKAGNPEITVTDSLSELSATLFLSIDESSQPSGEDLEYLEITYEEKRVDHVDLVVGGTAQLGVICTPSTADPTLSWISSNTSVATVSDSGFVEAVGSGEATVTVEANGVSAMCYILVSSSDPDKIESLMIYFNGAERSELSLLVGDTITLEAAYSPTTPEVELSWSSSDDSIVTVTASGEVTTNAAGSAVITVRDQISELVASCTIYVSSGSSETFIESLAITYQGEDTSDLVLNVGDEIHLEASYTPSSCDVDLHWTSDSSSIASVTSSGQVTANSLGTTVIRVRDYLSNIEDTISIYVEESGGDTPEPADEISIIIPEEEIIVYVDEKFIVEYKILPEGTEVGLVWEVENPDICEVIEDGMIIGISVGKTSVTVRDENETTSASFIVQVVAPAEPEKPAVPISQETYEELVDAISGSDLNNEQKQYIEDTIAENRDFISEDTGKIISQALSGTQIDTGESYAEAQKQLVVAVVETGVIVETGKATSISGAQDIDKGLPDNANFSVESEIEEFYQRQMAELFGGNKPSRSITRAVAPSYKIDTDPKGRTGDEAISYLGNEQALYENMVHFVDNSVDHMSKAALKLRKCSGESVTVQVKSYVSIVKVSSYREFDKETADNEFVEAVYKAIMLSMQNEVISILEKDHKPDSNQEREAVYQKELEAVKDYETFEIMVIEVLRQKWVTLTGDETYLRDVNNPEEQKLNDLEIFNLKVYQPIFRAWALDEGIPQTLKDKGFNVTLEELSKTTIEESTGRAKKFVIKSDLTKGEWIFIAGIVGGAAAIISAAAVIPTVLKRRKRKGVSA